MIPVMVELSGIDPDKKVNEISKEERKNLVHLIKHLTLTIKGLRGWNEAIITKGGVVFSGAALLLALIGWHEYHKMAASKGYHVYPLTSGLGSWVRAL